MSERDETMEAWGYFLAAITRMLRERGSDVNDCELDDFVLHPKTGFVKLYKKVRMRPFTDEEDAEIGAILSMVDASDERGTRARPCNMEEQGVIMLSLYRYDRDQMTVKEAAEELGVSTQAVYKMLKSGALRGVGSRGSRMVFANSVEHRKAEKNK